MLEGSRVLISCLGLLIVYRWTQAPHQYFSFTPLFYLGAKWPDEVDGFGLRWGPKGLEPTSNWPLLSKSLVMISLWPFQSLSCHCLSRRCNFDRNSCTERGCSFRHHPCICMFQPCPWSLSRKTHSKSSFNEKPGALYNPLNLSIEPFYRHTSIFLYLYWSSSWGVTFPL
jgi:hypothetical protein